MEHAVQLGVHYHPNFSYVYITSLEGDVAFVNHQPSHDNEGCIILCLLSPFLVGFFLGGWFGVFEILLSVQ